MNKRPRKSNIIFISLVLILGMMIPASAAQRVTVPVGTVIPLRMDTTLNSESSRVGDSFTATVFRDVIINRYVAVPVNSKVQGHVTRVDDADRTSSPGTIAVAFDRLIFPNNRSVAVDGTLTTLSDEARRNIEGDIDEENRVEGSGRTRRSIVFIGGGAGAGALIGALTGGGKGAAVGSGIGAVLGTLGVLLSKGDDAEVNPGTEFGMMVERSFTVEAAGMANGGDFTPQPPQSIFSSVYAIRSAQHVLYDRGYYDGPTNGVMTREMQVALRRFQRDQNIPVTGDFDYNTARALGMISDSGHFGNLIEINSNNARARRIDNDSVAVNVVALTQSQGWDVYTDEFARDNTLHVYVRGVPPLRPAGQSFDRHTISETYDNVPNVTRVVFHASNKDATVDIERGFPGGDTNYPGNTRQINILTRRLMQDYHADLKIRTSGNQAIFDPRYNFRENEVELLFQINALHEATQLYNQMVGRVTDPNAIKGGADSVIRQARLVHRAVSRFGTDRLSARVRNDWERLRNELSRITVVNSNLDFLDANYK